MSLQATGKNGPMNSSSQYAASPEMNTTMPPLFFDPASFPEYPDLDLPATVVIPHTSEANKPRNGVTERLPVSYSPSSVLNLEQAADLEELKQLVLADTPLARSVAPRLRMLRLIASRNEVIYTHPKAHWYKMKGWREVLECGHEHHVYQVEDLTAKRRNCPTCAKAAQLQNADELIQTLQDSGAGVNPTGCGGVRSEPTPVIPAAPEGFLTSPENGELIMATTDKPKRDPSGRTCQYCADEIGEFIPLDENGTCYGCGSCFGKLPLTPPKQPSQSVLRHKEKSA